MAPATEASRWTALRGNPAPPPERRELRAGPLTAVLDGVDLRYVRVGEVEVVRRIYAAVRDRNWNTIPGTVTDVAVDARADSFDVSFSARHQSHDTDFAWQGTMSGAQDGRIAVSMDGTAMTAMLYNRIGFCVLHPCREMAGRPFTAETPDGTVSGTFPVRVAPQRFEHGVYVPLFPSTSNLVVDLDDELRVRFEFSGDLFETEDQRNWSDASLKTYCTPLALGFPHRLAPGERRTQRVTVSVAGRLETAARRHGDSPERITVGPASGMTVPPVGLALAASDDAPAPGDLALLRTLAPAHLRLDLALSNDAWADTLARGAEACAAISTELELALVLGPEDARRLPALALALAGLPLARVLVIAAGAQTVTDEETTPAELVRLVRDGLATEVPVAGGTDMYFCELNRTRPDTEAMDGIFWSVNPQVHAFDDLSLVETPEAQAEQVLTALEFAGGRPLFVGPVTLKRRYNVNATVAEDEPEEGLPDSVDPRQASLLGAAWTLASLAHLCRAGVQAVTYFETVGWRGVIHGANPSPAPELFPGGPGEAFPLFHPIADVCSLRAAEVLNTTSSAPLSLAALALRLGGKRVVLAANLSVDELPVIVEGVGGPAQVRQLDEQHASEAATDAARFRRSAKRATPAANGDLAIVLSPYETVRIDW